MFNGDQNLQNTALQDSKQCTRKHDLLDFSVQNANVE